MEQNDDVFENAIERFKRGKEKFNSSLVKKYLKKGKQMSLHGYGISSEYVNEKKGLSKSFRNEVYRDARFMLFFTLRDWLGLKKKKVLASLGFEVSEDTLIIEQLQGVKGNHNLLQPFRWEQMLVAVCIEWAKKNRARSVAMLPSRRNPWWQEECPNLSAETVEMIRTRQQRLHIRYDVTAQRMGFVFDEEKDLFILPLN